VGTPDVRRALRVNGRLCWNPTDLTGTYPFGGTALGSVRKSQLRVRTTHHAIRAEEFAGISVDAVYAGEEYVFGAILSAWDTDTLTGQSLDAEVGATTGRAKVRSRVSTEGVRAGELVSNQSGILYFSPDAEAHPGVIFHKALPMREPSAEWAFRMGEEFGIPFIWLAVPNDDGLVADIALRQDGSV